MNLPNSTFAMPCTTACCEEWLFPTTSSSSGAQSASKCRGILSPSEEERAEERGPCFHGGSWSQCGPRAAWRLSDLRESGAIEQDADFVGLLYKPKDKDENEEEPVSRDGGPLQVNLLIAKHRNGPTGEVRLTFFKAYTRFESAAPIDDADLPGANQQAAAAARVPPAGTKPPPG